MKNLEDVAFEMYTNSAKLFDLNEQYFSFLRVSVHISLFEFHFSVTVSPLPALYILVECCTVNYKQVLM